MTDQRRLVERWLDLTVYAPIGLASVLRHDAPKLVNEGREKVEQQVQVARWLGEMAVAFGRKEVAKRWAQAGAARAAVPEPIVAAANEAARPPATPPPFEGYDTLAAAHIVQRLARLPVAEVLAVREYEAAHRARRTVLAKADQLLGV